MIQASTIPAPSTHRVLVVDDDDLLRETVKELLEMEGFEVSTAGNGLEALHSIDALGRPCFVLLDLMMPVMDGSTFLATIAERDGLPPARVPIVVFSALAEAGALAARYHCDVLPKPVSMERLIKVAERHCQRGGAHG